MRSYKFQHISEIIDELFVIRVGKDNSINSLFVETVEAIKSDFYGPFAIGGGIRDLETANVMFRLGADKLTLNEPLHTNSSFVRDLVDKYGSQAVVGSIDYKLEINNANHTSYPITFYRGVEKRGKLLGLHAKDVEDLGCGEILLRSIDRDGTAFGLDLDTARELRTNISIPLIISGGTGKAEHLKEGLDIEGVDAVCTANLLNFIDDGLLLAKKYLVECDVSVTNDSLDL